VGNVGERINGVSCSRASNLISSFRNITERELKVMQDFQQTVTTLPNGRYVVRLPWRQAHPELPTNKQLALGRTQKTVDKLQRQGRLSEYSAVFSAWEESGFIEKVPVYDLERWGHYLPHRPVYKEESVSTRIRPVFDASAHELGKPSLNDCLEKGPNLIEIIPNILERFRKHEVGVTADIEKAFLQLQVAPADRDYLRFILLIAGEVFRHCRVVFGVASSPFLL